MSKILFSGIIEELSSEAPFFQNYWVRASDIGDAIHIMRHAAKANGFANPICRECDPYDLKHLNVQVTPNPNCNVFWSTARCFFPPEPQPAFLVPDGIVASFMKGEHEYDEITRGCTCNTDEHGLTAINVNAESDQLFSLYSLLIQCNPKYKVFWYLLHDHWDDENQDQFLVNEALNSPPRIMEHLQENLLDSIQNGLVTLTAYVEEGATNLSISDHKRITIRSYSKALTEQYRKILSNSGYPIHKYLICFDCGIHHWHYRLPGSKSKNDLQKHLRETGFCDWSPEGA